MFERYTESAKRVVYFSLAVAHLHRATQIDSMHILCGLVWEEASGVQGIFPLLGYFPQYRPCPILAIDLPAPLPAIPLANDSTRVIASAGVEAECLDSYWVLPEHIVLAILRERHCSAAKVLAKTGLMIKAARRTVKESSCKSPTDDLLRPGWRTVSPLAMFWYKRSNR